MDSVLIGNLVECSKKQSMQPWPLCSFDEDFILVSEFSELVGPRPVATIPEDGGASFNKNTFTVRIMSVDCTSTVSAEPDSHCVSSFKTVGDTQVVLVEPSEGAVAYVHHFTLYDINARGYVRPFCMAYVTNQHNKIMKHFREFRDQFSRISAYFKYGNAIQFLEDLQTRLEYLNYTKRKLSENLNGKPIGTVYELPRDMKGFKFEDLEAYERDTVELKKITKSYLNGDIFEEQKEHFGEALREVIEKASGYFDVVDSSTVLENLDERFGSLEPRSIGISSGRKFDIQLRCLRELCSYCKEEAFGLLRNAHFFFGSIGLLSDATYSLNNETDGYTRRENPSKIYSKQGYSQACNVSREFFLSATSKVHAAQKHISQGSLPLSTMSSLGVSSVWTISSGPSRSGSYEMIKTSHGSSDDEYVSVKDTDSVPSVPTSIVSISSTGLADYQSPITATTATVPSECFPGTAKRVSSDTFLLKSSLSLNDSTKATNRADETDSGVAFSSGHVSWRDEELPLDHIANGNLVPAARQTSIESSKSTSSRGSKSVTEVLKGSPTKSRTLSKVSIDSSSSKESTPSPSLFFHTPSQGSDSMDSISLLSLRSYYKFLPHLIYSLMIGRPVIIMADRGHKSFVHSIVVALLPCVPGYPKNKNSVIMWTKGPILISNLATVKLVGLAKTRSSDQVPRSIAPYVTVLDFDKSVLTAPPYRGKYLLGCFDEKKEWPSEAVFRDYLHYAQLELSGQAHMVFSWLFSDPTRKQTTLGTKATTATTPVMKVDAKSVIMSKFAADDVKIILFLVEILKSHLLGSYFKSICSEDDEEEHSGAAFACIDPAAKLSRSETPSVRLNILKSQVFTNSSDSRKK
eukprot:gene4519-20772_t